MDAEVDPEVFLNVIFWKYTKSLISFFVNPSNPHCSSPLALIIGRTSSLTSIPAPYFYLGPKGTPYSEPTKIIWDFLTHKSWSSSSYVLLDDFRI